MIGYKNLRAWQNADRVAFLVFTELNRYWTRRDASTHDQLRRAALSVALNLAEGYASGPGARCRNHYRIAYASAVETTALLEFLERLGVETGDITRSSLSTQALVYRLWQRSQK